MSFKSFLFATHGFWLRLHDHVTRANTKFQYNERQNRKVSAEKENKEKSFQKKLKKVRQKKWLRIYEKWKTQNIKRNFTKYWSTSFVDFF